MYKIIKKATMMLFAAVLSIGMAVSAGTVSASANKNKSANDDSGLSGVSKAVLSAEEEKKSDVF